MRSTPEQLWPYVSDTDTFNRDTGLPSLQVRGARSSGYAGRRLAFRRLGLLVEWDEEPFEWVRPFRFGVLRHYRHGPAAMLRVSVELIRVRGGTRLVYRSWVRPRGAIGWLVVPLGMSLINRPVFAKVFRRYDRLASQTSAPRTHDRAPVRLAPGGQDRVAAVRSTLENQTAAPALVDALVGVIERGSDHIVARMRPYVLADQQKLPRRRMLDLCLRATRLGLLDMQWELLCPLCRGVKGSTHQLVELPGQVHCDVCNIDVRADYERAVEVTFRPNAAIRPVEVGTFCIGGPQVTPHVTIQQDLGPGEHRTVSPRLEAGRYRVRSLGKPGSWPVEVASDGPPEARIGVHESAWSTDTLRLGPASRLHFENHTRARQLVVLERTAWTDQAATAGDVTSLQVFRDLFSREILRPGERIEVGTLTVLFTDLQDSTRLYRRIGDAPAFGQVLDHFAVLRTAVEAADGAVVKTIGDAVMAVFPRPARALLLLLDTQRRLAAPGLSPLKLKAGMHTGPCLAVTLNDRLDYFGSTVNFAARLERYSSGQDIVISEVLYADPDIQALLVDPANRLVAERLDDVEVKGFEDGPASLWRVSQRASP